MTRNSAQWPTRPFAAVRAVLTAVTLLVVGYVFIVAGLIAAPRAGAASHTLASHTLRGGLNAGPVHLKQPPSHIPPVHYWPTRAGKVR